MPPNPMSSTRPGTAAYSRSRCATPRIRPPRPGRSVLPGSCAFANQAVGSSAAAAATMANARNCIGFLLRQTSRLLAGTVVWHFLTHFQRTEVRSFSGVSVGDVRQNHSAVHSHRIGLDSEVKIGSLVELLYCVDIVSIKLRHVHKGVVVDRYAVLILARRLHVVGQHLKPAGFEFGVMA